MASGHGLVVGVIWGGGRRVVWSLVCSYMYRARILRETRDGLWAFYDSGLRCSCRLLLFLAPFIASSSCYHKHCRIFYIYAFKRVWCLCFSLEGCSQLRDIACSLRFEAVVFSSTILSFHMYILTSISFQRQGKREITAAQEDKKGQKEVGMRFQMNYMTGPIKRR